MSQPQSPRGQFFTTLLLMTTIWLAFMLLFPRQPADTRSSQELATKLREAEAGGNDVDAMQLFNAYTQKLNAERGPAKWTQDQFDQREMEGAILVAHAKYKSALARIDDPTKAALAQKKLNDGLMILQQRFERLHNQPVWQIPVKVSPDSKLQASNITPDQLYDTFVGDLSVHNKSSLVWGMIPGYQLIDALVKMTGATPGFSYWFAAFLLALAVRLVILPISSKQYRASRQMLQLMPYVKEIQEKFKDKRTGQIPPAKQAQASAETMALYREYGINPFRGCSLVLVQLPFFWAVYSCMQLYRFEFVKGTFLWIQPGATKFAGLMLAPNLGHTDHLLIVIYGISMIFSQLLMPISDPSQLKQQRMIGLFTAVMVTVMMFGYPLPSAFTLYWTFANFLATAQALYAYRVMTVPPIEKVQTVKGGALPKKGFFEVLQGYMEEQAKNQPRPGSDDDSRNGSTKNGATDMPTDPGFFGKTGSPRSKKRK
ncbi:MAG: membrane protein insertase YidC [Armatimonadetes bacterium]|nr:membrane protein insertase YidC [Armatimonadota bacterium]